MTNVCRLLEDTVHELQGQISSTQTGKIAEMQSAIDTLQQDLSASQELAAALQAERDSLQTDLTALSAKLEQKRGKVRAYKTAIHGKVRKNLKIAVPSACISLHGYCIGMHAPPMHQCIV